MGWEVEVQFNYIIEGLEGGVALAVDGNMEVYKVDSVYKVWFLPGEWLSAIEVVV